MQAGNLELNITVSLGIADLNAGEMDGPGAMMNLADRALYAAKQLGRNRVVQAHDLHVPPVDGQQNETEKVNVLSKKLAGLDSQFKGLFLLAFEQVLGLLEDRDPHMADHTRKVQHYAKLIAEEMELPRRVIERIQIAAMMHDIGMVAMPDSILLCPTQLDEQQTRIMRRHPLLSVRIMERMEFLEQEIPGVRYHHERYDGLGYPEGISGASIPLTARIIAVADAFDAMTSPRTFRDAKSCAEALGEIHCGSSNQFDPTVVNAFMSLADRIGTELLHIPGLADAADHPAAQEGHFACPTWRQDEPSDVSREPPPAGT
jgi:HD-GYP domain-containing protein (c-di-GMP phosphodiesterase class II)